MSKERRKPLGSVEIRDGKEILIKIFRTIGFVLILFGAAIITLISGIQFAIALASNSTEYADLIASLANILGKISDVPYIIFSAQLSLLVGVLILVMTVGKSIFGKVLHVVMTLLMLVYLLFEPAHSVLFFTAVGEVPPEIVQFFDQFRNIFDTVDLVLPDYPLLVGSGVTALYGIVTAATLRNRKPRRLSVGLVKTSHIVIIVIALVAGIAVPILADKVAMVADFLLDIYYPLIVLGVLAFSFALQTIGSLIGSIFFFVK